MGAVDPRAGGLSALAGLGPLVLASASPRRAELLTAAGLRFTVDAADVDERVLSGESAAALAERLARDKLAAVMCRCAAGRVVLAGDTVVVRDGDVLGKPVDRDEARAMLASLAGRQHEVLSAVALARTPRGPVCSGVAVSRVAFASLDEGALTDYLDGGEWEGKAGAYAIQGRASAFAELVDGDLDTVVGLPVRLLEQLAARLAAAPSEDL